MKKLKELFQPNGLGDYAGAFFIVSLFFVGIIFFWRYAAIPTQNAPSTVVSAPTCAGTEDEYRALVDKGQSIVLTKDQWSYAAGGTFVGDKKVVARRGGQLACGYLYAAAHKGTGELDEKYDSIYINPQGLGGHILRPRSLSLSNPGKGQTEVLLLLSAVPYLPKIPYNPESQDFEVTDWVKLLNAASKIEFVIALSTLNQGGQIDEVSIAYKCWDPATGIETSDCQLSVSN